MFSAPVPTVTVDQLAGLVTDGWTVLDVRNDDEWADGHLAGATHLPLPQLPGRVGEIDGRIVCVCAVGGRSAQATEYLIANGHEAVNLDGGMQAWVAAGGPTER